MMCVNHDGSEFLYCNFNNQDEPSLAREFDKESRGSTSLTHILVICVVLINYDYNRPISLVPFISPI